MSEWNDSKAGIERRNRRVAGTVALVAVGMLGMAYAAVPLYQMFCQVTGFNGTTQRVDKPSEKVLAQSIRVRFDANVANGLTWRFEPVQRVVDVKIGENKLAFYTAKNTSSTAVVGTATFNVTPEVAGVYFSKVQCFCFTEQRLEAGEEVEMPVSFFVDPEIVKDADARKVKEITLSYTFYPVSKTKAAMVDEGGRKNSGG
ncbi:MAG: Cytochrome c oxidase assembly protein CtaG [Pseudomonadota bacterium]|jgi:cytochrome c oxidase assembly protein subunit 11